MPTLELAVDARQMTSGLRQAEQALGRTAQQADRVQQELTQISTTARTSGNNLSAAFAATGGGIAVTRGIVGIGDGLRSANSAMAAFSASQALLDLGRLSADFREVAKSTGATGGAISALGAVIKANPLLTIATVVSGVAVAMGFMKEETEKAATEWEKLADAIRGARLEQANLEFFRLSGSPAQTRQLDNFLKLGRSFREGEAERVRLPQLASQLGLSVPEAVRRLRSQQGDPETFRYLLGSRIGLSGDIGPNAGRRGFVPPEVAAVLVRSAYQSLVQQMRDEANAIRRRRASFIQFGVSTEFDPNIDSGFNNAPQFIRRPSGGDAYVGPGLNFGIGINAALAARDAALARPNVGADFSASINAALEVRREAMRQEEIQRLERQRELNRLADQFGATLGDALFNAITGAQDLGDALASVLGSFARQALQESTSAAVRGLVNSFAATSSTPRTPGG